MPDPVVAHPDTVKVVQAIHDTVRVVVRDTIVRLAEPASHSVPGASKSDLPGIITAVAVTVTALLALWAFVRDRIYPEVKVDYDFDAHNSHLRHSHFGSLPPDNEHCTLVTIRNRAERPIVVERVEVEFIERGKREFHALPGGKVGPLNPGATRYWFLYRQFAQECMSKGGQRITVVVCGRAPYTFPLEPATRTPPASSS